MSAQIITTPSGEELVVLGRAEYEALLERLAEMEEDAADAATYDAAKLTQNDGPLRVLDPGVVIGGYVRARRKALDMTQFDLAKAVDVGQGFISDLESGRRKASRDTAERLSSVLGVPVEHLTGT